MKDLPGQLDIVTAALVVGFLLLGIQLWLLTVALDMYLSGAGRDLWGLVAGSGVIFLGGVGVVWLLGRRPRVQHVTTDEAGHARKVLD